MTTTTVRFRSAIDAWLIVVLVASAVPFVAACFVSGSLASALVLAVVALLYVALLIDMLHGTYYDVDAVGRQLRVRGSVFVDLRIDVDKITLVRPCRTWLSSTALSVSRRIEVCYGERRSVVISPRHRAEFIARLQAINPAIAVETN